MQAVQSLHRLIIYKIEEYLKKLPRPKYQYIFFTFKFIQFQLKQILFDRNTFNFKHLHHVLSSSFFLRKDFGLSILFL